MLSFILPVNITLSFLFLSMTHPLTAGLTLLLQTALVATIAGLACPSFWFSYTLFLIFLGGMLVLFIYVASIASNEQFKFNLKTTLLSLNLSFFFSLLTFLLDPTLTSNKTITPVSSLAYKLNVNDSASQISPIYNTPAYSFTLLVICYLLLTLIMIVKIMTNFSSPLRVAN
uniref:NADH-ubiquinone oxidoreductase chain 6 n=1 Tax=Munidopsis verrilli TaxID=2652437 RepID=A0A5J6UPG9_9EUCA|nr:NADH dehydrogenase subunit 6 [Munidopsis verrilli]